MVYFYFLATQLISTCNILHIHRPEDKLIIFVSALQWLNNAISILILQVIIITRWLDNLYPIHDQMSYDNTLQGITRPWDAKFQATWEKWIISSVNNTSDGLN